MSVRKFLALSLYLFLGITSAEASVICNDVFSSSQKNTIISLKYEISDYFKSTSLQRTNQIVRRQIEEELSKSGIVNLQEPHLKKKWKTLLQNPKFNFLLGAISIYGISKGTPLLFLPDIHYKISPNDLEVLIHKGLESFEGKEIIKKYNFGFEAHRGYELFRRYYTRFVWAVLLYLVYDQTRQNLGTNNVDRDIQTFEKILIHVDQILNDKDFIQTKEDILFDTIVENFKKKYSREPSHQELVLICTKVYKTSECPRL